MLKIMIKRAIGLKAADINVLSRNSSDPYVIIKCGAQEKKSRVVQRSLDPEWNEVLELEGTLEELVSHGLLLKVFDKDTFTKDDPLGEVQVNIDALCIEDSKDYIESLPTKGSI